MASLLRHDAVEHFLSISVMTLRWTTAWLALLVLSRTRSSAQRPTCPQLDSVVARVCELDQWPLPETQRPGVRYPDILRQAGVEDHGFRLEEAALERALVRLQAAMRGR